MSQSETKKCKCKAPQNYHGNLCAHCLKPLSFKSSSREVGRCSVCERCIWNKSELNKKCGMIQPDGTNCIGVFK